ncbi:hypothetical protein RDABS01_035504 [Bienertia sinuspersici]
MIIGLVAHGLALDAVSVFSHMVEEKVFPDSITFLGILTACGRGFVELGQRYFDIMSKEYSIEPKLEHYRTNVDLLAPLGEIAVTNLSSLDGGDYVMLSDTYCSLNKWNNSTYMREIMMREGVRKDHGKICTPRNQGCRQNSEAVE